MKASRGRTHLEECRELDQKMRGTPRAGRSAVLILWEQLELEGRSLFATLAGFDPNETGFISVGDLERALASSEPHARDLHEDSVVRDWMTSDFDKVNYEGICLSVCAASVFEKFPILTSFCARSKVLAQTGTFISVLSRFDTDQDGFISQIELEKALRWACSSCEGHEGDVQDLVKEFVLQIRDDLESRNQVVHEYAVNSVIEVTQQVSTSTLLNYCTRMLRRILAQAVMDGIRSDRVFEAMDCDRDGVLSIADLQRMMEILRFPQQCVDNREVMEHTFSVINDLGGGGCSPKQLHTFILFKDPSTDSDPESGQNEELAKLQMRHQALEIQARMETQISHSLRSQVGFLKEENTRLLKELERLQSTVKELSEPASEDVQALDPNLQDNTPPNPHAAAIYRDYTRQALIQHILHLKRATSLARNEATKARESARTAEWRVQFWETKFLHQQGTVHALEESLQALDMENDKLRCVKRNGIVVDPSPASDSSSRKAFWSHLLSLGDAIAAAVLREAVRNGDLFTVQSLLNHLEEAVNTERLATIVATCDAQTGDSILHCACRDGCPQIVQVILDCSNKYSLNLQDVNSAGQTPLQICLSAGNIDAVRVLLPATFDSDLQIRSAMNKDTSQYEAPLGTPELARLAMAPASFQAEFEAVLKKGLKEINLTNRAGCSPLFFAAFCCAEPSVRFTRVKQLLQAGADISQQDVRGWTVLHYVAAWGMTSLLEDCILKSCTTMDNITPAQFAHILILATYASNRQSKQTLAALFAILKRMNTGFLRQVFTTFTLDNMYESGSALVAASKRAERNIMLAACECGFVKLFVNLIKLAKRADLDIVNLTSPSQRTTPLMVAAAGGNLELVEMLTTNETGFDLLSLNARDKQGQTALFFAAQHGHVAVCEALLKTRQIKVSSRERNVVSRMLRTASDETLVKARDQIVALLDAYMVSTDAEKLKRHVEGGWVEDVQHSFDINQRPEGTRWIVAQQDVSLTVFEHELHAARRRSILSVRENANVEEGMGENWNDPDLLQAHSPQKKDLMESKQAEQGACLDWEVPQEEGEHEAQHQLCGRLVRLNVESFTGLMESSSDWGQLSAQVEISLLPKKSKIANHPTCITLTVPLKRINGGLGLFWDDVEHVDSEENKHSWNVQTVSNQVRAIQHTSLLQLRPELIQVGCRVSFRSEKSNKLKKKNKEKSVVKGRVLRAGLRNGFSPFYDIVVGKDQDHELKGISWHAIEAIFTEKSTKKRKGGKKRRKP